MNGPNEYERIAQYIAGSEMPRKQQMLDGLRRAALKRIPMKLVSDPSHGTDDMILM